MPSERTLQRKMELLRFVPGVLGDIFTLLKTKLACMQELDQEAGIVFDEMSIAEVNSYNVGCESFIGTTTLPPGPKLVSQAMVFMLVGVRTRWKQVVAYHFTGKSNDAQKIKENLNELISKAEDAGAKTRFITSDCCAQNKAVWSLLGIDTSRYLTHEDQTMAHPLDNTRLIEVKPDVVHLFKSVVRGFLTNKVFLLFDDVVKKYNLNSAKVDMTHLIDLIHFEEKNKLKVAHKLELEHLLKISSFDSIKVENSVRVCNLTVAAALRYYAVHANRPDVLPTALFIEIVSNWFNLLSNRSRQMALSKGNLVAYNRSIGFLRDCCDFFFGLAVGGSWEPWQSATILATKAISYHAVRIKQKKPSALQFQAILKQICVSQYMLEIANSSYEFDGGEFIGGIKAIYDARAGAVQQEIILSPPIKLPLMAATISADAAEAALPQPEKNALYYRHNTTVWAALRLHTIFSKLTTWRRCDELGLRLTVCG
ncbi:uncharacterized protein LOC129716770 [Wyeomyia smithii]|uniref:uncharacterized protein LOC129716770 n=1 Tax=Wyeomyia smithii TaxID=174621 RepID=UPI002467B69B|nr:uncharacterized protein LOC129716770 [Wyeomyia smithii]